MKRVVSFALLSDLVPCVVMLASLALDIDFKCCGRKALLFEDCSYFFNGLYIPLSIGALD